MAKNACASSFASNWTEQLQLASSRQKHPDSHLWKKFLFSAPKQGQIFLVSFYAQADIFVYVHGIVRHEFVPQAQSVNQHLYTSILWLVREDMRGTWRFSDWFLHHDKAHLPSDLYVQEFVASNGMTAIPYPP